MPIVPPPWELVVLNRMTALRQVPPLDGRRRAVAGGAGRLPRGVPGPGGTGLPVQGDPAQPAGLETIRRRG